MTLFGRKAKRRSVTKREADRLIRSDKAKIVEWTKDGAIIEMLPEEKTIEEVPITKVPNRVPFEIFEQKDDRAVIIKKGKWAKGSLFVTYKKRDYYPNHIIKESVKLRNGSTKIRYMIRWKKPLSEAVDKDGRVVYSEDLEQFLMMDMTLQARDAAITLAGLQLDRTMMVLIAMAFVFGIPIGLSYNSIFHWVPPTVVHWVVRR